MTTESPITKQELPDDLDIPVVIEQSTTVKLGDFFGQCKWFDDVRGYGFITVVSDGDMKGKDVFVHHSVVQTLNSNYRTLRKGEYIQFDIGESAKKNSDHQCQAMSVTGILGGPLMCDVQSTVGKFTPDHGRKPIINRESPPDPQWRTVQPKKHAPVKNKEKYLPKKHIAPPPPPPKKETVEA